ncbi:hypothetical protein NEHOM01_2369 [Nematocida homosporus]|uniref:uncharacterized protein n=1 Tax=Nematocida homosporus TaxID=1912981 RepID=UPI0022209B6B|nr:uncharacterized protein NEHOM01_2369 [Nematocida homosporus]KAI5187790.1 hypothetical protein NEHOM01_2369 [Nematocida homosporus]
MPRIPFEEKTNDEKSDHSKVKKQTDREYLINHLSMLATQTRDYALKYDIKLCTEILQGKENQAVSELKEAVTELAAENEQLTKQCDYLNMQLYNQKQQL